MQTPLNIKKPTCYGAAGCVGNIKFDKKTGEILNTGNKLYLDDQKIKKDAQLDGYYAIVTSKLDESDDRIIELYRGLWRN